ncbi:hypothetical protein LF1_17520 [Rubripirellula obstinata]|uniref:Uncharacterized protein n=2 Tax=Rubripirellula obstinata TaxID=406547 RepID=A0A5B1CIG3_9BACT|nr:hypothetical protein LF1_17520 [Rubripirellula obstinata]
MTTMNCPTNNNSSLTAAKESATPRSWAAHIAMGLAVTVIVSSTGCFGLGGGYNLGFLGYPMPVSPYYQHKQEEKFWKKERYERVPILGPTTSGGSVKALDPPSDDEVMHALETARPVQGGIPLIYEKQRNNVRIIKEKISDYIDPPRFYPLIGPAQLHHAHYKCTIYFDEKTTIGYPVPHTLHDEEAIEVVYIDHNHFHMVGDVEPYTTPNL